MNRPAERGRRQTALGRAARRSLGLAWLAVVAGCGSEKEERGKQPDRLYTVTRGDFNVVVSANGTLDAIKRYKIEAPPVAKQGLDIIEAVPDQSVLRKGDLIVAFSDESYQDELGNLDIKIEEAEKNRMLFEQDYQMQIAEMVSQIKKATDLRRVSVEAHEKYRNEDAPLAKKTAQQGVESAQQALRVEEAALAVLREDLSAAAMESEAARKKIEDQVKAAELKVAEARNKADKEVYNLRILKQYTYPQKSRELEREVVKTEMDLQKQLVTAAAQRIKIEGQIRTQNGVLQNLQEQRSNLLANVSMLRVVAPVDGVVTYGNPDPRRAFNQQQKEIIVGASMRPSELIGTIPDLSQLIVNVDVPEAVRSKVAVGMRAEMRIKALPNVRLAGMVSRISDLASNLNFWDQSSPKVYPTVITLDQSDPLLRPGMSVEVDMISERIRDVLYVPVEALTAREGAIYGRVRKLSGFEERKVTTGRASSSFVEILEGLEAGEQLLLNREEL
jgi:multidrug efflux pump subunit AcrA (membrane-fusion protein)